MWHAWIALTLLSSMAPRATADSEPAPPPAAHAGSPPAEAIADPVGSLDADKTPARPGDKLLEAHPHDSETGPRDSESSPRELADTDTGRRDSEPSPHELATNPHDLDARRRDSEPSPHELATSPHDLDARRRDSEPSPHELATSPHDLDARRRDSESNPLESEASRHDSDASPQNPQGRPKSPRSAQRTLNRNASELAWRTWLQSPESRDPGAPPRRITPKSVFVAPYNCPDGKRIQGEGCAKKAQISAAEHERHALEQLNKMQLGAPPQQLYDYDDDDAAAGPLQLDLLPPPPPSSSAAAAALVAPAAPSAQSFRLPTVDKKQDPQDADLEAELERLKWQLNRINPPLLSNPQPFNEYHDGSQEKPKRDSANHTSANSDQDQGQKEVIYGNVGVDLAQYLSINRSDITDINNLQKPTDQTNSIGEVSTDTTPIITQPAAPIGRLNQTIDDTSTTHPGHNLKENEKPTKLHPEIDYSDLSEAVKIISRYAEVTTDDMFKSGQKKYAEEEGTLGTRTKLQHRRRPPPAPFAAPARSIYEDRVPAHILYPPSGPSRFPAPAPPPHYPFRHVQEYWAHPERYLGPYAHANPRRHRHSYSLPQPPRRARPPAAAGPPAADLYALLGLRHWFSGDGAAER